MGVETSWKGLPLVFFGGGSIPHPYHPTFRFLHPLMNNTPDTLPAGQIRDSSKVVLLKRDHHVWPAHSSLFCTTRWQCYSCIQPSCIHRSGSGCSNTRLKGRWEAERRRAGKGPTWPIDQGRPRSWIIGSMPDCQCAVPFVGNSLQKECPNAPSQCMDLPRYFVWWIKATLKYQLK